MATQKSSARVVDGKLILSFPGALTPVLWQMDLQEAKASAIEILEKENQTNHNQNDEKISVLTLKTPKGEKVEIAPFEDKDKALKALLAISKALENAQGQIRPQASYSQDNNNAPYQTSHGAAASNASSAVSEVKSMNGWITALIAVAFIITLISLWAVMAPPSSEISAQGRAAQNSQHNSSLGSDAVGVPLSADEYLRKR